VKSVVSCYLGTCISMVSFGEKYGNGTLTFIRKLIGMTELVAGSNLQRFRIASMLLRAKTLWERAQFFGKKSTCLPNSQEAAPAN